MKINLLNKKTPASLAELKNILLENRELKTKKEIEEFLEPISPEKLTYKNVGIDEKEMKKALKLIKKYINVRAGLAPALGRPQGSPLQKKIVIYSDYDADGVCSGAILWQALYSVGADVTPFIPSREEDGYGLSKSGIDKILALYPNKQILIITVDNGIVANEAAEYFYSVGDDLPVVPMGQTRRSVPTKNQKNSPRINLIITDHHVKGEILPTADCILHTTSLCGAGVAWILAKEILKKFKIVKDFPEYKDTLDILTIATVADMVPLTKFNRRIVKFGFEKLKKTTRPGILAIFKEALIKPEDIGTYTIGFVIAPRLNAMGRLTNALSSLRLLCTRSHEKAEEYARELGVTNRDRQNMTFEQTEMANSSILKKYEKISETKILITADTSYNQGVIGLIAGRLMERYHKPAIVISIGEKISKASTRSIKGFNIIEHLREVENILINCGGHPMAAGFTIETTRIDDFKIRFTEIADRVLTEDLLTKKVNVECKLPINLLNRHSERSEESSQKDPSVASLPQDDQTNKENIISLLGHFSPFGMQNQEPIFLTENLEITNIRLLGQEQKHLKLVVKLDSQTFDAIGFNLAQKYANLQAGQNVSLIYTVSENTFNGKTSLQMKIKEIIL